MKAIKYTLIFIPLALFLLLFINNVNATVTISNVSPVNNSIHVDIVETADGGYVNLSWQLNDSTGGGDMEFYMDIWNGSAWLNRVHQYDVFNGSWYHHEDTFNQTNTTYQWRLRCKDVTDNTWTNQTFSFTTDRKPNPPFQPSPANGSMADAGSNITLKVNVTHPDASAGAVIHNVSFFEYPSGRLIGWNYSASGFTNGTIVRCNQTFHLHYAGTKYYWYAKAMDDEYWSNASDIWYVETYYNDTEPNIVYYSIGADVYVQPVYTESEPNIVYYSIGGQILTYYPPQYSNPSPNATTNEWLSVHLSIDINKSGNTSTYWNIRFVTNATVDGSWATIYDAGDILISNVSTTVNAWWSGLDWNTKYYWKVSAYNATYDRYSNSSVYSFTTQQNDTEPDITYYSIGADIYVRPTYTTSEPNITYYSLGAQIAIYNSPNYYNPSPNATTGEWLSVNLSIQVNKTGDENYWDFSFLTNATVDGSWAVIDTLSNVLVPNATLKTIYAWFSGLDWNTTYYWCVSAYNSTLGVYSNSSIFSFTTRLADPEPNITYYSLGADIYVRPTYTTSEPDVVYYSLGGQIPVSKPYPQNPIPANNTAYGSNDRYFSVYIYDVDASDIIDKVEFYWINGTKFGQDINVPANSRASAYVSGLSSYTWYTWYVKVYDGNWTVTSDWWRYRPGNNPPVVVETPANNSDNVAVYRKLVGGEYKRFVRLEWNLTDADGDGMNFTLYIDDPSLPNNDDWIMRWQQLGNSVSNGTYYHDELLFNETGKQYYWRLVVSDGKNTTDYHFTFISRFFIDFWWIPQYPTQEDTVNFYSLVEGADSLNWSFGDGYYSNIQNTTHQYELANYYNVTLTLYNTTHGVNTSLTKWIRVDRNITLHKTGGHAGINYITWHLPGTTLEHVAENLSLSRGEWIHHYNKSEEKWDSLWYQYAGKNVKINQHDVVVVTVAREHKARINTTTNITYSQSITATPNYNYIGWTSSKIENVTNMTNYGFAGGDWVHYYDTVNGTWKSRWLGYAGDKYNISPYDVLVGVVNGNRSIHIGD